MANGQKRAKIKKVLSPPLPSPPQSQEPLQADEGLLDDLLAELDNRSPAVQQEAAAVLQEIQVNQGPSAPLNSSESKKGSKKRFKEREVCCRSSRKL